MHFSYLESLWSGFSETLTVLFVGITVLLVGIIVSLFLRKITRVLKLEHQLTELMTMQKTITQKVETNGATCQALFFSVQNLRQAATSSQQETQRRARFSQLEAGQAEKAELQSTIQALQTSWRSSRSRPAPKEKNRQNGKIDGSQKRVRHRGET